MKRRDAIIFVLALALIVLFIRNCTDPVDTKQPHAFRITYTDGSTEDFKSSFVRLNGDRSPHPNQCGCIMLHGGVEAFRCGVRKIEPLNP